MNANTNLSGAESLSECTSKTHKDVTALSPRFSNVLGKTNEKTHMKWWKQGVIYQIYPRSFQDSNGDGIGDLKGLIERLDYLNDGTPASLGIDAIWLSPIYPSPMADFGYDISDYCDIAAEFGTLEEFDCLISEAHQRNIRVVLDLVANHTSDQHPWFIESCDPKSAKADWYIWHEGSRPPNNWLGCFGGSAWTWHPKRQAWYLHSFLKEQPDLNWRNPAVVEAMFAVMDFWLDRGVDGFRLDVVNFFYKDEALSDNPVDWFKIARPYDRQRHLHDRDQPEMHVLLKKMRQHLDQHPDRMMVGEVLTPLRDPADLAASYQGNNDELHLAFNFEFLHCPFSASEFRRTIQKWLELLGDTNWPTFTLGNHDVPRHSSRYANGETTHKRMRLLALMLMTLKGTPFLYYGEELGMPEQKMAADKILDPLGKQYWPLYAGRDGCRRPMMWSPRQEDFSTGESWIPSERVPGISVEEQENLPHSLLNWYRTLIWMRKNNRLLQAGSLRMLSSPPDVLAYERSSGNRRLLVLLNFSNAPQQLSLTPFVLGKCLACSLDNGPDYKNNRLKLLPLQALLVEVATDAPKRARI
jgi:alpha-glucosidase